MTSRGPSDAPEPTLLGEGPGYLFAGYRGIVVAVWTIQGTGELADALGRVTERYLERHPTGISSVHIIAKNPPLPTAEARTRLGALTERFAPHLAGVGSVLEGTGFWASALRSV